jgi:hypothetical protein
MIIPMRVVWMKLEKAEIGGVPMALSIPIKKTPAYI